MLLQLMYPFKVLHLCQTKYICWFGEIVHRSSFSVIFLLHIIFVKLLKLIYRKIHMYLSTVALSEYEIPSGCPRVTAGTIFVDILFELTYSVFVNSTNDLQYLQILRQQCCLLLSTERLTASSACAGGACDSVRNRHSCASRDLSSLSHFWSIFCKTYTFRYINCLWQHMVFVEFWV